VNAGVPVRASAQFRPIEVAALEKRQRHLKNPGLATLKFEFLSTLRHGTALSDLYLGLSNFSSLPNHNPGPTFRAGHARARNAIRHFKIILPLEQSAVDGIGGEPRDPAFLTLGNFVAVCALGGGLCAVL
jgi:hypothetical protein